MFGSSVYAWLFCLCLALPSKLGSSVYAWIFRLSFSNRLLHFAVRLVGRLVAGDALAEAEHAFSPT